MPKLLKSKPDDVTLAHAVETKFLELCGAYLRIKGSELPIPPVIDKAILLWRRMRVRHTCKRKKCGSREIGINKDGKPRCMACGGKGDYRHTEDELKAVKDVASWTVQVNASIRNQPPVSLEFQ